MSKVTVRNLSKQALLGDSITVADSPAARRTGLLKHESLAEGEGLWILPCEAVHTFWMKFPIDVIFVNRKERVTKIVSRMKRSRIAFSFRAQSVIELPAGTAEATGTEVGDVLEIRRDDA